MSGDLNKTTGHGVYFSGNFEIEEQVSTDLKQKAEYRTYAISINCGGADGGEPTRYEIRALGYGPDGEAVKTIVATVKHTDYHPSVNRASTTLGHQDPSEFAEKRIKIEGSGEASGRPKPKKFVPKSVTAPFKSPIVPAGLASTIEAEPADFPQAPPSPTGSDYVGPPGQAPVSKKRPNTAAAKPRVRARPARRTSSTSTLDLTTQE
ncbi:uncharacterized protein MELLADRAFT_112138 [Melampsora larici-populina 98AG31]|uniref:Uncharacterized protein n=1 Tax=Melampsora larici-populina (strain 98AG31 / pathotype 3-4-7) TaxID=747676 RepID=F4S5I4_MELLP|nr:uncharacterized protein MELLADRAFT_112138 [Melampsora larici-populina 98AG31]EGG00100.1 hypothetical protein MELLADRAFT_112138 [Melampsora larici-populina 98AG31]